VFGLWAGPVAARFVRFGGFVSITPELGREWPLGAALASWGLLVPAAALGAVLSARRGGRVVHAVLLWGLGTALLIALARARAELGWDLAGNATLLHQGRVWPVAHLLAAALGGAGLAWAYAALARRSAEVAAAAAAVVLGVGALSPVAASAALADSIRAGDGGYVYALPDAAPGSFVRRAAALLGPDDVVRVDGPRLLALLVWQFSGARLAAYDDPRLDGNDLRIRYRDLAAAWDRRMSRGGFGADYAVVPATRAAPSALVTGTFRGATWMLVPD
jgi:hypothetical protein